MKKGSTFFLKTMIVFIAVLVLAGMVIFPQTEGRADNLDLVSIYSDPLIIYAYVGSIPFFVGLYQAFKFLDIIDGNKAFSVGAVNALRNMKYASVVLVSSIVIALMYIRFFVQGEDSAGPIALGILVSFLFAIIGAITAVFQKLFQHAIDLQAENEEIV